MCIICAKRQPVCSILSKNVTLEKNVSFPQKNWLTKRGHLAQTARPPLLSMKDGIYIPAPAVVPSGLSRFHDP